jgi:hypothetical protein
VTNISISDLNRELESKTRMTMFIFFYVRLTPAASAERSLRLSPPTRIEKK